MVQLDMSAYTYSADSSTGISLLDSIVNIVPTSFVGAFTGTEMLQIIFLAILAGAAATMLDNGDDRQKVTEFLGLCNRFFLKVASHRHEDHSAGNVLRHDASGTDH